MKSYSPIDFTIGKLNSHNIYNGCFQELKNYLTDELPEGQNWTSYEFQSWKGNHGIKNLIGNSTVINEHNTPYNKPPAFFKIFFGNHYIQPFSYALMGRRIPNYKGEGILKSWDFFGLTKEGRWKLLDSHFDEPFSYAEERTFIINAKESFKGFMINMTETNNIGNWALCLGQIDVHGFIFNSYNVIRCPTVFKLTCDHCGILFYVISLSQ